MKRYWIKQGPYSERIPSQFRTDAGISIRKDKTKTAWMLSLDIQNLLGIKNTDVLGRHFDPSVNQWVYKKAAWLIPVLSYQVDF